MKHLKTYRLFEEDAYYSAMTSGSKKRKKKQVSVNWIKAYDNKRTPVTMVNVKDLRTNPNEVWSKEYEEGLGKDYVDRIAKGMRSGKDIEALSVKRDGTIIDGQHRFKAAIKAGLEEVGVQYV